MPMMIDATMMMLTKNCISRDIVVEEVSVSDARFAIRPMTVLSAVAMTIPRPTPSNSHHSPISCLGNRQMAVGTLLPMIIIINPNKRAAETEKREGR